MDDNNKDVNKVNIGQSCKNKSCKAVYKGPPSDEEICTHHPGVPIFHEGLKYWSCCQKKTTDFSVFLEQPGCLQGNHLWIEKVNRIVQELQEKYVYSWLNYLSEKKMNTLDFRMKEIKR